MFDYATTLLKLNLKTLFDYPPRKLSLFSVNLNRREVCNFLRIAEVSQCHALRDEDIATFAGHLNRVTGSMEERFVDLLKLEVHAWYINPYVEDIFSVEEQLQEDLIDLQSGKESRSSFTIEDIRASSFGRNSDFFHFGAG